MALGNLDAVTVIGTSCYGAGGYEDLRQGAAVIVKDDKGATVATGRLGEGTNLIPAGATARDASEGCRFQFEVPDVPKRDFYEVSVTHRGGVTKSYEELTADDWQVQLTL